MHNLILHHYPLSPFSEKVRAVLGFKQLAWQSVTVPTVMPKPDLLALTGGYRKTPVLQIGADVYCDTALICDVLEQLAPKPTLYPPGLEGLARMTAQWADSTLFWAAMGHNMQKPGMAELFAGAPADRVKAFVADRSAMAQGLTRPRPRDATVAYRSYLRWLSGALQGQNYVLGNAASLADFAIYHALWFTRTQTPVMADVLQATPAVLAWMDRIAAFGHGQLHPLTASEAIAVSSNWKRPKAKYGTYFQDDHGIALGQQVSIAAESFGSEPTVGELIGASRTRYVLRRFDAQAGCVHVHFPRVGYALKLEQTE
jgi:glutathione S-transferase